MHYGEIITNDTANGPGIRLSLFVSGCTFHCKGCFNEKTWDFNYGRPFTNDTLQFIIDELKKPQYDGITILGGEPLHPNNRKKVTDIIYAVKNLFPEKTIWVYTGYEYKQLMKSSDKDLLYILANIDTLVDGPFIESEKDITLSFRGSRNQHIIPADVLHIKRKEE